MNITHKEIVEAGGGRYVGMMGELILFDSPTTGSTLALPPCLLSAASVRKQIAESDARFAVARLK